MPHRNSVELGFAVAGIATVLFWPVSIYCQTLRENYNPLQRSLSELALGSLGWIQMINFIFVGLLIIGFTVGLFRHVKNSHQPLFRVGVCLLLTTGIEIIIIAFVPTAPYVDMTLRPTPHGIIAGTLISFLMIASFLLLPALKADPRWRGLYWYTLATGIAAVIIGSLRAMAPFVWVYFGLHERLLLANGTIWFVVMGVRLLQIVRQEIKEKQLTSVERV